MTNAERIPAAPSVRHSGTPERLSLPVLAALCDILDVTPDSLIATRADNVAPRKAAAAGAPEVTDLAAVRPKRARHVEQLPRPRDGHKRRKPMTLPLPAALRAAAEGLYVLEAATGLIIAHGT